MQQSSLKMCAFHDHSFEAASYHSSAGNFQSDFSFDTLRAFWWEVHSENSFGATNVPEHLFGDQHRIRHSFDPGGSHFRYFDRSNCIYPYHKRPFFQSLEISTSFHLGEVLSIWGKRDRWQLLFGRPKMPRGVKRASPRKTYICQLVLYVIWFVEMEYIFLANQ